MDPLRQQQQFGQPQYSQPRQSHPIKDQARTVGALGYLINKTTEQLFETDPEQWAVVVTSLMYRLNQTIQTLQPQVQRVNDSINRSSDQQTQRLA